MTELNLMKNRVPSRAYFESALESCVSLDGIWRFKYYDAPARIPEVIEAWDELEVPSCWQLKGYDQMHYTDLYYQFPLLPPYVPAKNPTGVYEREIHVEAAEQLEGHEHRFRFHGVDSQFSLWVNGYYIGESTGSRYTSEFDVTAYLKKGVNTIRVIVSKWSVGTFLEDQDMWWLSGIFRSVQWLTLPKKRIENYRYETKFRENYTKAHVTFHLDFSDASCTAEAFELAIQLTDATGREVAIKQETVSLKNKLPVHDLELELEAPLLWTAETPHLYDLSIVLSHEGKALHHLKDRIGFREVRVLGQEIQVNGKQIRFKGVNRHDFNCDTGRTVSLSDMRYDLELMKKSNMNAVRTAHYPNSPEFYALCDEIGLYVISEADLECHGFELISRYDWLSDDAMWTQAYVDRAERLVLRDINRPSIIMWSLGNESEFGRNFIAMAETVRRLDSSRLIHYEGDRDVEVTDVYSTMYTRFERLEEIGRSTDGTKPHLLCEYAHAMGNGPGGLLDYQRLFRKYPRLHGGFIWEWIDHGIRAYDAAGRVFYKYGGDYGDAPHNSNFNCDGLLFPDRTPSPALNEVKKVFAPIWIEDGPLPSSFQLTNDYDHLSLDHVVLTCETGDKRSSYKILGLEPRAHLTLKWENNQLTVLDERVTMVALEEKTVTSSAEGFILTAVDTRTGHELMKHQLFILPAINKGESVVSSMIHEGAPLIVRETQDLLIIETSAKERQLVFDKVEGQLVSYDFEGTKVVKEGPKMNFWRAPIDNDMYVLKEWKEKYALHLGALYPETFSWEQTEDQKAVIIKTKALFGAPNQTWHYILEQTITVSGDGSVAFHFTGRFKDPKRFYQASLPKIGSMVQLSGTPVSIDYYGLGPFENYPDSQYAALLSAHEATPADLFTHYPYPQDNGNRGQVTHMALHYEDYTWQITFEKPSNFSYRPYSDQMLEKAGHMNDLIPEGNFLHLDYKVNGLGSNSCGPEQTPEHKLKPIDFDYGYKWTFIRK